MTDMVAKAPIDQHLAGIVTSTIEGMGFQLVRLRLMGGKRVTLQIMAERSDGTHIPSSERHGHRRFAKS